MLTSQLELHPLCTVDLVLENPIAIGEGPKGNRLVVGIDSMKLSGERIQAKLKGRAAADWFTIVGTTASIDVRATLETQDGALIYLQYSGRSDVSKGIGAAPMYVAPRFETSDERYLWLNAIQAIGKGSLSERRYEWFEAR